MDADAYLAVLEIPDIESGEVEREYLVSLQQPEVHSTTVGEQGPPGRQGIPGPAGGAAVERVAGETLSALRVVYELDGQVFALDYRDASAIYLLLGLTLTAAAAGGHINVQRSGPLDDAAWNWTPGPVWLGADGGLTQVAPVDGFCVLLGSAVSPTRLILDFHQPISMG